MVERKRIDVKSRVLPINELYLAIQCEGSRIGRPCIMIRTTGCTHRCHFGEGGWCDAWYSSIHPEKGAYKFNDISDLHKENPQITDIILTGGAPTMHPALCNELTHYCHEHGLVLTIETEGSHYVETDYPIDLISLSPKFSNSIPEKGIETPKGKVVDSRFIKMHNRFRLNEEAMRQMIAFHEDYHYKPVWNGTEDNLDEIEAFRIRMGIPKEKTWLMPAGGSRKSVMKAYPTTLEMCIKMGYNFTPRPHIVAYDDKRKV